MLLLLLSCSSAVWVCVDSVMMLWLLAVTLAVAVAMWLLLLLWLLLLPLLLLLLLVLVLLAYRRIEVCPCIGSSTSVQLNIPSGNLAKRVKTVCRLSKPQSLGLQNLLNPKSNVFSAL